MNDEQLMTIAEDIEYLAETWEAGCSDAELRRGSAILRRFFIDDVLGQAWRQVGNKKQPRVVASDLEAFLSSLGTHNVLFAFAGGTKRVVPKWGSFLYRGSIGVTFTWEDDKELIVDSVTVHAQIRTRLIGDKGAEDREATGREMPIGEFLKDTCAYMKDLENNRQIRLTRHELIQYFANFGGGVHLAGVKRDKLCKIVGKVERLKKRF